MSKVPARIEAQPLYILPGATRAEDRVVPVEKLRIELHAETGGLLVTVEGEPPLVYANVYPCRFSANCVDALSHVQATGRAMAQGDLLPEGAVTETSARKWFATSDGCVYSGRPAGAGHLPYTTLVERLQARVDPAWIADALEPNRRRAAFQVIAAKVLAEHGWTHVTGVPASQKTFQTAAGDRVATAYVGPFDSERYNCTLQGGYMSEGRNVLESHGVLIPWDAEPDAVMNLVTKFAEQVDSAVGDTYAARLHSNQRPRGG